MLCPNCQFENEQGVRFCAQCGVSLLADQQNPQVSPAVVQASNTGMFSGLKDLSLKRTAKQAVGFYIAYAILIMIIAGLLGGVSRIFQNILNPGGDLVSLAVSIGQIVATIATLILAGLILAKKQLLKQPLYLILALVSGMLSYFAGAILGLIVVAYFSTLEAKNEAI